MGEEREGKVVVRYACEREHLPVAHGDLLYDIASAAWLAPHSNACLQRMAECYVGVQMERRPGNK